MVRGECGVFGWRGESEVHLGGAATEKGGCVEIESGVFVSDLVGFGLSFFIEWIEKRWLLAGIVWRMVRGGALVVAGELVEGPLPAVALVFDKTLQHGDGDGF